VFAPLKVHAAALASYSCSRGGFAIIRFLAAARIRWRPLLLLFVFFFPLVIVVLASLLAGQLMLRQHFVERHKLVR
jgi:hypothetical protein